MPAQKGKDVLLKVDNGGTFVSVAGLRTRRLTFNAQSVDVTNSESAGRWRELLEGAGVRHASLNGNGIFKDEASDIYCRQVFFDGSIKTWQVTIPSFGIIAGLFQDGQSRLSRRSCRRGHLRYEHGERRCSHLHRVLKESSMANAHRGDVDLAIGSEIFTLRFTLQSLAEMEAAFGVADLVALGNRLSSGQLAAGDVIRILGPAMRGGGTQKSDVEIAALMPASHLQDIVAAISALLTATFGEATPNPI